VAPQTPGNQHTDPYKNQRHEKDRIHGFVLLFILQISPAN